MKTFFSIIFAVAVSVSTVRAGHGGQGGHGGGQGGHGGGQGGHGGYHGGHSGYHGGHGGYSGYHGGHGGYHGGHFSSMSARGGHKFKRNGLALRRRVRW